LGKSAVANRLLGSLQVDIKHTKTTLQWQPPVSMDLALEKTVAAYLAHS
jgi:dTDP-D-glucose 4,6-dehydratase